MRVPELCSSVSVDLSLVHALVGFVRILENQYYSVVLIAISDVRIYFYVAREISNTKIQSTK